MAKATSFTKDGKQSEMQLAEEIFGVQVNVPVMHEVVTAQLAAARAGTHSTKTRAEVRGGGRKPWRQKGTGRARHGSTREPQWVGGGIAHGPKPRDYSKRINRKVKALALRSALSDRAREGKVMVVELPSFDEPETKKAVQLLDDWGIKGSKTLLIVSMKAEEQELNAWKSFRNLPEVFLAAHPTPYHVLAADTVVFTKAALDELAAPASTTGSDASARPAPPSAKEASGPDESPVAETGSENTEPKAEAVTENTEPKAEESTEQAEPDVEEEQS